jgi:hypothetical protein
MQTDPEGLQKRRPSPKKIKRLQNIIKSPLIRFYNLLHGDSTAILGPSIMPSPFCLP